MSKIERNGQEVVRQLDLPRILGWEIKPTRKGFLFDIQCENVPWEVPVFCF